MDDRSVGIVAGTAGVTLYELSNHTASLDEAFMELTRDAVEYTTRGAAA
jgi:ABC-2 type transport system ATP-binding protein